MKRVLAIVLGLCLLSGLSVNADIDTIEGSTIAGGGASDTCDSTSLISNCAEGSGTPTGWTDSGTVDWDESTTVLEQSESLELASGGSHSTDADFTAASSIYGFVRIRPSDVAYSSDTNVVDIRDSGDTSICRVTFDNASGGRWGVDCSDYQDTPMTPSADTNYCLWFTFIRGDGSNNGTMNFYYDECTDVCSSGTCTRSSAAGSATYSGSPWDSGDNDASNIILRTVSDTGQIFFDQIIVDSTDTVATVTDYDSQ
jgi:hypothetical protein